MTSVAKINYKGIARAGSDQQVEDGYLDEAINARHREGKLTTRGTVTKLYELPDTSFDIIRYHDQDEISNYIGYKKSTGQVHRITFGASSSTSSIICTLPAGTEADIAFIKRFMIITTEAGIFTFLFDKDQNLYLRVDSPEAPPLITVCQAEEHSLENTDAVSGATALLGKYFELVNNQSASLGRLNGSLAYRIALKMFDGSYVMHTIPRILILDPFLTISERQRWINCAFYNLQARINPSHFTGINADIYTHAVVFISRNYTEIDVNESTLTDDVLETGSATGATNLHTIIPSISTKYSGLPDSEAWYNVFEKKIEEIQEAAEEIIEDIDTKGFYQDFATRETLIVDQFSHSKLSGQVAYTYNDRILIGDTKTEFGKYKQGLIKLIQSGSNYDSSPLNEGYFVPAIAATEYTDRTITFIWALKTNQGEMKVINTMTNQPVYKTSANDFIFVFPQVIGYPDTRATSVKVVYHDPDSGNIIEIAAFKLTASKHDNYAYYYIKPIIQDSENYSYHLIRISMNQADFADHVTTIDSSTNTYIDSNRIQASELQNPLFFPSKYSYQISTGTILGIGANTEPLSQGQFGEYPLSIFTDKGIWTMLQGAGDVLFSNIIPVNGEVILNKNQIIPLSVGVAYTTARGLYIISGREVRNISEILHGPQSMLRSNTNYQYFVNHANLVQLLAQLSSADAKAYIANAKIGFDKANNELIVTNSNYTYSYAYSFESGFWYKLSESFRLLVNAYPELLGVNTTGIHSLSNEDFAGSVQTLLVTRPCKLGAESTYKLIRELNQRCEIEVKEGSYAGFYAFGSNDLRKWALLAANNTQTGKITDIRTGRGYCKAKYYIFVFAANLMPGSAINELDIRFDVKLATRLR